MTYGMKPTYYAKHFDAAYFDGDKLILEKHTGEESGFIIHLYGDAMELWGVPQYGGLPRLEKAWEYSDPIEAYDLAMSWS